MSSHANTLKLAAAFDFAHRMFKRHVRSMLVIGLVYFLHAILFSFPDETDQQIDATFFVALAMSFTLYFVSTTWLLNIKLDGSMPTRAQMTSQLEATVLDYLIYSIVVMGLSAAAIGLVISSVMLPSFLIPYVSFDNKLFFFSGLIAGIMFVFIMVSILVPRLWFVDLFIIDGKMKAVEAVKASWMATRGRFAAVTWFLTAISLLWIVDAVMRGVASFYFVPVAGLMKIYVYRAICKSDMIVPPGAANAHDLTIS